MTIPIYKNIIRPPSKKYWTTAWKHLVPFEVLSSEEVYQNYYKTYEELKSFSHEKLIKVKGFSNITISDISEFVSQWNNLNEGSVVDIAKRHWQEHPNDKFLYVEIPYQFFEDHMTDWLEDEFDIPLSRIKKFIKRGDIWSTAIGNTGKTMPNAFSFLNYFTFYYYGVANPIFNNGVYYPKRSTHITAFTSIIKSDVPILLQIDGESSKFKILPNKMELPYFNKSYLTMEVDIENKSIDFFLDDTKHIGVYKYETEV